MIGHVPKVTLEEGCERYVDWYQQLVGRRADRVSRREG